MKKIIIRPNGSKKVVTVNDQPSMTDQSFEQETNANFIVRKFNKTRDVSLLKQRAGQYADVSEIGDLGDALMKIQYAKDSFATLPATLRKKFDNDPQEFINYLNNSENDQEAIELGLKIKKDVPVVPQPDVDKPKARQKKQQDLPIEQTDE